MEASQEGGNVLGQDGLHVGVQLGYDREVDTVQSQAAGAVEVLEEDIDVFGYRIEEVILMFLEYPQKDVELPLIIFEP